MNIVLDRVMVNHYSNGCKCIELYGDLSLTIYFDKIEIRYNKDFNRYGMTLYNKRGKIIAFLHCDNYDINYID